MKNIWITSYGDQLDIKTMSEEHLKNSFKLFLDYRNDIEYDEFKDDIDHRLIMLCNELKRRIKLEKER